MYTASGIGGCFCDDGNTSWLTQGGDLLLLGFYTSGLGALEVGMCYLRRKEGALFLCSALVKEWIIACSV